MGAANRDKYGRFTRIVDDVLTDQARAATLRLQRRWPAAGTGGDPISGGAEYRPDSRAGRIRRHFGVLSKL